ncbi:phage gp36-like protein [Dysgonomonadaceae bacterium PH5-43]|nr:phage gp36-like protein [Dysgonomonadaceae bacterium PH5-43]
MSQFINIGDYKARIHREILDALVREDESIIEIVEDQSIALVRSYLNNRYDCDKIFSATGSARNQLVLMMALDITVYNIFKIHNPQKMSQVTKDAFERAMIWLKEVNKGSVSIDGAPLLPEDELAGKSPFLTKSNRKRTNHY